MGRLTVYSQPYTQDSTRKVSIEAWQAWRLIHDAKTLKVCETIVSKQDSTIKIADSLLVVGETKVNNLEQQILVHEQKDQDQEAELIVTESYYEAQNNHKNKTIATLGFTAILELILIIILL